MMQEKHWEVFFFSFFARKTAVGANLAQRLRGKRSEGHNGICPSSEVCNKTTQNNWFLRCRMKGKPH